MKSNGFQVLLCGAAPLLAVCIHAAGPLAWAQESHSRPNIVFMLADDLGYGDLPAFGAPFDRVR